MLRDPPVVLGFRQDTFGRAPPLWRLVDSHRQEGPVQPTDPDRLVALLRPGDQLVVPLANGEPTTLLDTLESHISELHETRIHQMHALHDREYLTGAHREHLAHVSYFLSHVTRPHFHAGGIDLVPANFSEVPDLLRRLGPAMILAAASPMDRHGYFSLGPNADYVAPFIGHVPFFLEASPHVPRTFGRNQVHVSQIAGWVASERPLVEVPPAVPDAMDERIAALVAERIVDGDTIQAGIGAIPNAILSMLTDHRHLGLHTELISDGVLELVASGTLTGARKTINPNKLVGTFALGTRRLYDFLDNNAAVELWPVDYVNDPRIIAQERSFVSINATTEVDLLGQCASETIAGRYYSGSGGQADFARGAMYCEQGRGFVVLRSTTRDGSVSRIRAQLSAGSVVTTLKNTVDHVVTEYGVAALRGRSIRERATALIRIAHPDVRDQLTAEARDLGYL
jgi:acyl-CoA hydrolase